MKALFKMFIVGAAAFGGFTSFLPAQVVDPHYAGVYEVTDLGAIPGVPMSYGGVTFKYDNPNILLIGGSANNSNAAIYAVELERDCSGSITGFAGKATFFASASFIDGGLTYGPGNVLFYTTYSNNTLGQIIAGQSSAAKIIDLNAHGIASSTGTLAIVPNGFPGAGQLKIASYNASSWYSTTLIPDGAGTYDLGPVTDYGVIGGGPEGIVYISDVNPLFDNDSVLISEYSLGRVSSYEVNKNGDPIIDSRRTFISGLSGAEGSAIDPLTGDFLFSTFGGGGRLVIVNGFIDACPADIVPIQGDGVVNVSDLLAIIGAWGQTCVPQDINNSGSVNVADLLTVIAEWGPCN